MHEQDRAILLLILVLSHHCSAQIQGCSSQLLFQCFSPQLLLLPATCLVSEWTLWSQCSCVSGAGSRFRTRSVVPSGGGIANCGGPSSFTCRTGGFSCTNGAVSCSDGSQPLQIDQNSWGSCDNHRETQPCFLSQCSHGKQFILCFLLQMNRDPVGSKNCF